MHVPDRGERASDARILSVFIGLGVVSPIVNDLKVAIAIAQQVQDFALWSGVCRLSLTREYSLGYLVETRAAVLPAFPVFGPVGGAMRVLPEIVLM